jgi:hypothetical protein
MLVPVEVRLRTRQIRLAHNFPGDWTDSQLVALRQGHLFVKNPKQELQKIPFAFRYEFKCEDDSCTGHKIICTDWEMGESYR